MRRFKGECAHFSHNKCPIYTHDGASAKFSTNSHETDYSVGWKIDEITKQRVNKKMKKLSERIFLFGFFLQKIMNGLAMS